MPGNIQGSSVGEYVATGSALGSVIPGVGTVAGGLIGGAVKIFSGLFGSSEDKSAVGFQNFMKGYKSLPQYPTKDQMISASVSGNWDAGQKQAVLNTYDPNTGHLNEGDWNGEVISVDPITVRWFKGGQEQGQTSSDVRLAQAASFQAVGSNAVVQLPVTPVQNAVFGTQKDVPVQPASLLNSVLNNTPGAPPVPGTSNNFTFSPMQLLIGGAVLLFFLFGGFMLMRRNN